MEKKILKTLDISTMILCVVNIVLLGVDGDYSGCLGYFVALFGYSRLTFLND